MATEWLKLAQFGIVALGAIFGVIALYMASSLRGPSGKLGSDSAPFKTSRRFMYIGVILLGLIAIAQWLLMRRL